MVKTIGVELVAAISPFNPIEGMSIVLHLPAGAYLAPMSSDPVEKNIILIYNADGQIIGTVGQTFAVDAYNNKVAVENIIHGSHTITYAVEDDSAGFHAIALVSRVYIQRDWSYYFSEFGFNGNTSAKHDYYMAPIAHRFLEDESALLDVLPMSWDAINRRAKSYLTGSDLSNWNTYNTGMYNQYRCHYNFVARQGYWNLEVDNAGESYATLVARGCNPHT